MALGFALAGASLAVAGAGLSAGAIFSAGADCCAGELGPGLVPWAAANPLLATNKAAEIKNLFLMEILLLAPRLNSFRARRLREHLFIGITFVDGTVMAPFLCNFRIRRPLTGVRKTGKVYTMRKAALILATAATLAVTAVAAPAPAEARGGFGPGLAGGLIAGALIGGLASNAYGYGPGYGYYGGGYGGGYYGGYAPAYYGGSYYSGYAPAYYGYRYRRVYRPAYAYYGGWHHRGYRHYHRHW